MKKNLVIAFLIGVLAAQSARSLTGVAQMDALFKQARALASKVNDGTAIQDEKDQLLVIVAGLVLGK